MKLGKDLMLKLMKEEYDKRVSYYLGEIEIKDKKRNVNLIEDAKGLKVRNQQGLELTIEDFVIIDNIEYVVLRPPEIGRAGVEDVEISNEQYKFETIKEAEDDNLPGIHRDLRKKNNKMDYKRTFKDFDASYDSLKNSDVRDGLVYVKISDFEKEYSL